jgi:hypothetical protein
MNLKTLLWGLFSMVGIVVVLGTITAIIEGIFVTANEKPILFFFSATDVLIGSGTAVGIHGLLSAIEEIIKSHS